MTGTAGAEAPPPHTGRANARAHDGRNRAAAGRPGPRLNRARAPRDLPGMAKNDDAGDRTEKPTPKRIKDARKDGTVAKSKELTSTLMVLVWVGLFWLLVPMVARRLSGLFRLAVGSLDQPFPQAAASVGWASVSVLLVVVAAFVACVVGVALVVEFLQAGPVFAPKKVKPDLSHLNPAEGFKRMFSMDNLVEVAKAVVKTAALAAIAVVVVKSQIGKLLSLPQGMPGALLTAMWSSTVRVTVWVIGVFLVLSLLDLLYQRYSFTKKLRMSRRDIQQEMKDDSGDPHVRSRRKQLHQEWANQNVQQAVRQSSVVVTNPTHLAVALVYEPGETVVPLVTAKGEGHIAQLIRETAESAGVPIMRNVPLARGLHAKVDVDEFIPAEFFEAVAELLRWADGIKRQAGGESD